MSRPLHSECQKRAFLVAEADRTEMEQRQNEGEMVP